MSQTYATRAKQLISKYKRAGFDKVEKAELNKELESLANEQELHRINEGIGEYGQQQFGLGGSPEGYEWLDQTDEQPLQVEPWMSNPDGWATGSQNQNQPYSTSIVPSLATAGLSTLGNLYLANQSNKNRSKLSNPRVNAEQIDLSNEREEARRATNLAGNIARRNIRNAANTRGEYLGNVGAAEAAINSSLMNSLGRSYQQEAMANAQERSRAGAMNAQLASQESQYNAAMLDRSQQERNAYIAAALQGIPVAMKDIASIQQQDALINSLGEDYGIFMQDYPGRKWYQPKQIVRSYRGK